MTPLTRIYELSRDTSPRAEHKLLHEFPLHLPSRPEGSLLTVNGTVWRIRYAAVTVDTERDQAVLVYTVQDAKEAPRL